MGRSRRRNCKHCRELFTPDHRNKEKQGYCSKPECRKASKAASQKKWQQKEKNKNYFRGPENVRRVQEWRKNNPGYWKKRKIKQKPLQDLLSNYPTVLVGLLANLSGSLLQDDIVQTGLRLQQLGRDILSKPSTNQGGRHDSKQAAHTCAHDPPGS